MDKVFEQDALNSSRANHLIPVDVDVHEPPPAPEWMTSLKPPAPPIRPRLALSPVAPEPLPMLSPMPQLTGVVQGPGGNSSAIFQLGATSLFAGIGEAIGSSGWRLDSISSGGAVISQQGQQRTLSVGGLF